jgi:hypothetical protein
LPRSVTLMIWVVKRRGWWGMMVMITMKFALLTKRNVDNDFAKCWRLPFVVALHFSFVHVFQWRPRVVHPPESTQGGGVKHRHAHRTIASLHPHHHRPPPQPLFLPNLRKQRPLPSIRQPVMGYCNSSQRLCLDHQCCYRGNSDVILTTSFVTIDNYL